MTGKTTETSTLETLDKERVLHPSTSIVDHLRTGPRIMAEGSGVMLTDASGRRYLDAFAGLWCVNIGYGRTEVARRDGGPVAAARLLPHVLVDVERAADPAGRPPAGDGARAG